MANSADKYENWVSTYQKNDWEADYQTGRWNYLAEMSELPRYAAVAGYLNRFADKFTVLDAGCGEGILQQYLDQSRVDYVGFDLVAAAVTLAHRRFSQGRVFHSSIEEFTSIVKYDAIVFNEAVQQTPTPLEILDRYRGYLTERGYLVLSLFKNMNRDANGPRLARFIEAACAEGRYSLVDQAEAISVSNNRTWRIFVIR